MTYDQALDYLNGLIKFGIRFGLERITALAEAMGNPHRRLRVIHIGGTNGKGSTATFVASILREAGYETGLYLSPYIHDVRERIQINGAMIPKQDFAEIISEIKPIADKMGETELGPVTEFEVKTLVAYLYMARKQVDFAVLEVGMGGRFDATNIVQPLVSVITNVSLDHTERLGATVDLIAFEKSGIIKPGGLLVTAVDDEQAWRVILGRSREEGAEVWRVIRPHTLPVDSPSADVHIRYETVGEKLSVSGCEVRIEGLRPGLRGWFQHANAATAIAAILALRKYEIRITRPAIAAGIANAYIPGRLEVLRDSPMLVIDGAHNPDAAHKLARAVQEGFRYEELILVVGMLSTHPSEGFLSHLAPMASTVIATQSQWDKATPANDIADSARRFCEKVEVVDRVPEAVNRALEIAGENDLILVTGSFYTIGEVPPLE